MRRRGDDRSLGYNPAASVGQSQIYFSVIGSIVYHLGSRSRLRALYVDPNAQLLAGRLHEPDIRIVPGLCAQRPRRVYTSVSLVNAAYVPRQWQ